MPVNAGGQRRRRRRGSAAAASATRPASAAACARPGRCRAARRQTLTTIGKKQISAMIRIFGASPKPRTSTISGATTGIGTACEPTTSGRSARSTAGTRCIATASADAEHERGREPEHDLPRGRPAGPARAATRSSHSDCATCVGAGSSSASTHAGAHDELPDGEQDDAGDGASDAARARGGALTPPPPARASARSRSSTTAGSVRARGRGSGDVELEHDAARARREQHDPVGEQHRLLDVVGDQQHGPRLARQRLAPATSAPARASARPATRTARPGTAAAARRAACG